MTTHPFSANLFFSLLKRRRYRRINWGGIGAIVGALIGANNKSDHWEESVIGIGPHDQLAVKSTTLPTAKSPSAGFRHLVFYVPNQPQNPKSPSTPASRPKTNRTSKTNCGNYGAGPKRWVIKSTKNTLTMKSDNKGRGERQEFSQMFQDAAQRKFDLVLFWALDRFTREGLQKTIFYLRQLDDCGVKFHSYTEPYLNTDQELVRDILLNVFWRHLQNRSADELVAD